MGQVSRIFNSVTAFPLEHAAIPLPLEGYEDEARIQYTGGLSEDTGGSMAE